MAESHLKNKFNKLKNGGRIITNSNDYSGW